MKFRSAFLIQCDVIFAIILREMHKNFSGYALGNIWIILEPLLMMIFFILIFGVRGRGEFGFVEPPIFILAAFLPFRTIWRSTVTELIKTPQSMKSLRMFRQIRLFDVFVAKAIRNGAIALIVGTLLVAGFLWMGFSPLPDNLLGVFGFITMIWLFGFFCGLLASVLASYAKEFEKLIRMLMLPLLFLSAVFYPMSIVPEPYRTALAYNPLVHIMELIREAWFAKYVSPVADLSYFGLWLIATAGLSLAAYRLNWKRMMAA